MSRRHVPAGAAVREARAAVDRALQAARQAAQRTGGALAPARAALARLEAAQRARDAAPAPGPLLAIAEAAEARAADLARAARAGVPPPAPVWLELRSFASRLRAVLDAHPETMPHGSHTHARRPAGSRCVTRDPQTSANGERP